MILSYPSNTGLNDTSKMDPRLVIWNIKSSFVVPDETNKVKECPVKIRIIILVKNERKQQTYKIQVVLCTH